MIRRWVFFGIFLLGLSCGNKLLEKPDKLIPKDRMADILYDIALIDAIDNSHPQVLTKNKIRVMEFIYSKYGIDSTRFAESDLYYASVPLIYEEIYTTVEDRLNRKRDSITKLIQESREAAGDSSDLLDDYD